MKKTATFVLLALLGNLGDTQGAKLYKTQRISADSFSNVGEDDTSSSLMKMGSEHQPTQSMAQQQVSADLMATSGTLKKIQEHQNKMDEILETADREMNLGKQELENIDKFEKTLEDAKEENKQKLSQVRAQLAQTSNKKIKKASHPKIKYYGLSEQRSESEIGDFEDEASIREAEMDEFKKEGAKHDKENAAKKLKYAQEVAKMKAYKKSQMADGLYRNADGSKVFADSLAPVDGVNSYNQVEPPAKQLGGDTDTKNQGEAEAEAQEVDQSKKDSEKFQADKKAREAAEEAEKKRLEKLASRNPYDGLIHQGDGSRWDAESDAAVAGVNNYHQTGTRSKHHEPKIRPWRLGEIGENEDVGSAMDRQAEIDAAEAEMTNRKRHAQKIVQREHESQQSHKQQKKHHSHVQTTETPAKTLANGGVGDGKSMEEDDQNGKELAAADQEMKDAEKRKKDEEARELARRKEEEENRLGPDGLHKRPDGTKVYKPDNQVVGGVNLYSQTMAGAEPPAAPVDQKDNNVETIKEGEQRSKDIAEAKDAFAKKEKAEADDAAAVQKANEEAWATLPLNAHDGLQHWGDGTKHYTPDKQKVGGVNNYAEITHRRAEGKAVAHEDVDIETLSEKESRQREIDEAEKVLKKEKKAVIKKKKEAAKVPGTQMDDGLYHTTDGRKFFMNGQEVSGVNNLAQERSKAHHKSKSSHKHKSKAHSKHHSHHKSKSVVEPPSKPLGEKENQDTKSMKEDEDNSKELGDAAATMEKQEKDKAAAAAAEAKAAAEKAKADDEKRRTKADGLIHMDDGTRVDPATKLVVGGVNNHAQVKAQDPTKLAQNDVNGTAPATKVNETSKAAPLATSQQSGNTTTEKNDTAVPQANATAPAAPNATKKESDACAASLPQANSTAAPVVKPAPVLDQGKKEEASAATANQTQPAAKKDEAAKAPAATKAEHKDEHKAKKHHKKHKHHKKKAHKKHQKKDKKDKKMHKKVHKKQKMEQKKEEPKKQ